MVEYNRLDVYSKTLSLKELQEWIDLRYHEYLDYLKTRTFDKQYLLNVSWNNEKKDINIEYEPWESNVSFDNSYFPNKDKILSDIKFFLENEKWYKEKGIPYNLGILLYGKPGGGKTRFIKQILNYTKRHGLDIKLCNTFDLSKLKSIIQSEKVGEEFIIPQNNRIIIFEDIDAMSEIVKDRNKKDTDKKKLLESIEINTSKNTKDANYTENANTEQKKKNDLEFSILKQITKKSNELSNNNLSYLLNIFDGLHECSGRIIIMTTNKPKFLDEALIRPGRIDIKIELGNISKKDVYKTLQNFWKDELDLEETDIRDEYDNTKTPAEIINLCRSSKTFEQVKHHFI